MKTIAYTFGLLVAAVSANLAQAAPVIQTYAFKGILNDHSQTVTGGFTLLQDAATQTASLQSIDFTIGSTVYSTATAFLSPNNVMGSPDAFILWGNVNNPFGQGVQGTTEDFYFTFNPFTDKTWDLAYSQVGVAVKHSTGGNLTLAAVPEAGTWAMMISGFALAGAAMRRRKMVVRFA
ncbi:MAG: PEPxxWA-CTERM sorting domain-containing protein [Sphingomonas sp.]